MSRNTGRGTSSALSMARQTRPLPPLAPQQSPVQVPVSDAPPQHTQHAALSSSAPGSERPMPRSRMGAVLYLARQASGGSERSAASNLERVASQLQIPPLMLSGLKTSLPPVSTSAAAVNIQRGNREVGGAFEGTLAQAPLERCVPGEGVSQPSSRNSLRGSPPDSGMLDLQRNSNMDLSLERRLSFDAVQDSSDRLPDLPGDLIGYRHRVLRLGRTKTLPHQN